MDLHVNETSQVFIYSWIYKSCHQLSVMTYHQKNVLPTLTVAYFFPHCTKTTSTEHLERVTRIFHKREMLHRIETVCLCKSQPTQYCSPFGGVQNYRLRSFEVGVDESDANRSITPAHKYFFMFFIRKVPVVCDPVQGHLFYTCK